MEKVNRKYLSKKAIAAILPGLLISLNIFLFGPFTIYHGNMNEFILPFLSILKFYIIPFFVVLLGLSTIGLLLTKNWHQRYVAVLFSLGVLIWLQGNILVWDYGVVGKGDIDWTKMVWRGWIDGLLWILLVVIAYVMFERFYKITTLASATLVFLQTGLLIFMSFQQPKIWEDQEKLSISMAAPQEIFEFSANQNVIHVILDELESDIFQEIIEQDEAYYYKTLEGFIFFKETTGSFPTTLMSVQAFLSGKIYGNDTTTEVFLDSIFKGRTIYNVLYHNGYDVDVVGAFNWYSRGDYANSFTIPVPYGVNRILYEKVNSAFMLSVVLFRHVPHHLKKLFYRNAGDLPFLNPKKGTQITHQAERHFSHKAFLEQFIKNMSVNRENPVYKLIHLTTTHWPIVLNGNCEYA